MSRKIKRYSHLLSPICLLLITFVMAFSQQAIAADSINDKASTTDNNKKILTENKQFDAWNLRCLNVNSKQNKCFIIQNVSGKQGKARLLSVRIHFPPKSNTLVVTFYLPLGIFLIPGMSYDIDAGVKKKLVLRTCIEAGCIARMSLDAQAVRALQNGKDLHVRFSAGNKEIISTASLMGFSKALAALKTKNK